MRISIPKPLAAMMVAMVFAVTALASTAVAQTQVGVSNSSGCSILLTLVDGNGNLAGQYPIPSSTVDTTITLPPGFVPVGVEDVNGRNRRFASPPASPCTPCIELPTAGGGTCCVQVCYDSTDQKMTITACSPC